MNEKTELSGNVYYKDARVDHVPESVLLNHSSPSSTKNISPALKLESNSVSTALPFHNAKSLLDLCVKNKLTIAQVVHKNELHWRSELEIKTRLMNIWHVMNKSILNGLSSNETHLPGSLNVPLSHHMHSLR